MLRFTLFISSVALVATLAFAASCGPVRNLLPQRASVTPAPVSVNVGDVPPELKKVLEVWEILSRDYVDPKALDLQQMSLGAINGMLTKLNDPYTSYLSRENYRIASQDLQGSFEGIGANVSMRNGLLVIVAPIPGTPAEKAGIRPGDVILEIDGVSTKGLSLNDAILRIRGQKGTPANLVVQHLGAARPESVQIVRGVINVDSVIWRMIPEESIAHIRITGFMDNTDQALRKALDAARKQGAKALILDLRDNPGGLLSASVDVASEFLKDGLVLYDVDGHGNRKDYSTRSGGVATDLPMAVLVNEFSASGSELVAGALQDRGRAVLIGEKTFGKGSVNILRSLSDGSGLYVTFARWYTPLGRLIEGQGLIPDITITLSQEQRRVGKDQQLEEAVSRLQNLLARS